MASVTLEHIGKTYPGGVHAVRDFSLSIEDGEFLVLVGPSGCGKSTTLRMIAGLDTISEGTLKIGDRVVNDVQPRNRDIAMVFQNYALYPHMTVRQNMAFALKMRKTPKAEIAERVKWAAGLLGLEPLLDRKPRALSGGQRQRVALGRAIVRQPAVFLFDEPLSNLDAKLRVQTRAEIKRLHRELKTTTIYVTHDQEEAMTLGDRVVVMADGWMRQCDTPLNVYRHPADLFVAGFLGMPPMNFLEGKLSESNGQPCFHSETLQVRLDGSFSGQSERPVIAGIRPESFAILENGAPGIHPTLSAEVQVVEPLGSLMDIFLTTASGQQLVCRIPARPFEEGKTITLTVNPAAVHLFAPNAVGDEQMPIRYGENLRTRQPEAV